MNRITSDLNEAVHSVEKLFRLSITKRELLGREDGDAVINCFLTDKNGEEFFLKEIQAHSLREGMDNLYQQLLTVHSARFRFILPKQYEEGKFSFTGSSKHFLLFKRETLAPFDPSQMKFQDLLLTLTEMHQKISGFNFSGHSYRNFSSWIERGLDKVIEKYGKTIPLVPKYKKFMQDRYPALQLGKGNIHWDIHKANISLGVDGRLEILDIDLMQTGEYACDLTRAAYLYATQQKSRFSLSPAVVEATTAAIKKSSPSITERDVRFFIARTPLGPMQLPDYPLSKDEAITVLQSLSDFVG